VDICIPSLVYRAIFGFPPECRSAPRTSAWPAARDRPVADPPNRGRAVPQ